MRRFVAATENPGKLREIGRILRAAGLDVELVPVASLVPGWRVEETGEGYLENALAKAEAAARATGLPSIADDSGIEVAGLGWGPGPRSARFAGETASDEENNRLMLERLEGMPREARRARYRCVAVLAVPKDDGVLTRWFEGVTEGEIAEKPRGEGGFGYDPLFIPWEHPDAPSRTMAELSPEEKDAISHRGRAFAALARAVAEIYPEAHRIPEKGSQGK